tara:strand:- start:14411 stop:14857 length:447 start_codon:yes stop_codon:yes gene_type:complete
MPNNMKKAGMKYQYGGGSKAKRDFRDFDFMMGGSTKAAKRYAKYGKEFKDVPASNPGLAKLPKEVRNKMGYAKKGKEMMYGHGGGMGMGMKKYMYNGQSVPGMYEELEEMQRGGCFNARNCKVGGKHTSQKKRARQAKRARRKSNRGY